MSNSKKVSKSIAVAIRYHPQYPAPLLLAKGKGVNADKIKELGKNNNIPIIENSELSQGLMSIPEGSWIPEEYFEIMASILAAVFQLENGDKDEE